MGRAERNNNVTPTAIEQREPTLGAADDLSSLRSELAALRERIAVAAVVQPQPHELHCRDCFNRGRDAALRTIADK